MARDTTSETRGMRDPSVGRGVLRLLTSGELDAAVAEAERLLRQTAEMLRGSDLGVHPLSPDDTPLGTYEVPEGHEEVERYWVNAPFAYVVAIYDTDATAHQYHIVEPDLDEFEASLLERVRTDIRDPPLYRREADP